MNRSVFLGFSLALASLSILGGCGNAPATNGADTLDGGVASTGLGEANVMLATVPTGVLCVQLTVTGSTTITQTFTVTPGSSTTSVSLGTLPVGSVTITGQAYSVACSSISGQTPTWLSTPVTATIQAGAIVTPTINFHPNNTVTANIGFTSNVAQLAVGGYMTYVVSTDGSVRGAGYLGALGLSTSSTSLTALTALSNVAQIATAPFAYRFACAILNTGAVVCWGDNSYGELGTGGTPSSSTVPLTVSGLTNVVELALGDFHACALKSDSTLWCWGYNVWGQIGNGTTTTASSPVQVLSSVQDVSAGHGHTCAVVSGRLQCWGDNSYGQSGNGNTTSPQTYTYNYTGGLMGTAVKQVGAGGYSTCGLRSEGSVYCWGYNGLGQLGIGSYTQQSSPTTAALTSVEQIAVGAYTVCARRSDKTVWCWGLGTDGELGDGNGSNSTTPVQVQGLSSSASVVGRGSDFCSIGVDSSIKCWGYNLYGEMGNGTTFQSWTPASLGGASGL